MSIDHAFSAAEPSDLLTILQTNPNWTATIGAAVPGTQTPFVVAWPLQPIRIGEALASESAGVFLDVWQISCFGKTVGQAKACRDALLGLAWPTGWEVAQVGPCIEDPDPAPVGWFIPVDMRYVIPG